MNGDRPRQAGAGNQEVDSPDDAAQTPTELEPMCSSPYEKGSTDVDGLCRPASADTDKRDGEVDKEEKWTTFGDILERFAADTSLLGVPRAILAESRLARLFWVVVCVTCMAMFIQGTTEQVIRYFSYPKQVRVI